MAEPNGKEGAVKKPEKKKRPSLKSRVAELEGDAVRLAELLGRHLGGKFQDEAYRIATKRQGK